MFDCAAEAHRATLKDRLTFSERFGDRFVRVYHSEESDANDLAAAASGVSVQSTTSSVESTVPQNVVGPNLNRLA